MAIKRVARTFRNFPTQVRRKTDRSVVHRPMCVNCHRLKLVSCRQFTVLLTLSCFSACSATYPIISIITPHRGTTYVDAVYCYRLSSVVCRSVCHTSEPCKKGWTDRDAVWVEDLGGPKGPCIRWGFRSPMGRGKFLGENGRPIVKYRDILRSYVERRLNR